MALDIVGFQNLAVLDNYSAILQNNPVIIAKQFSLEELDEFGKNSFKTKFFSCKIFEKKDNSQLQAFSKKANLIGVKGASADLCFWAANAKNVSVLFSPFNSQGCFLDLQTANVLRENNVFVCILLSDFLESAGMQLSQLIKNACAVVKICSSAKVKIIFATGAKSEMQLRSAKDLSSFGVMLGMKIDDALWCVKENSKLLMLKGGLK